MLTAYLYIQGRNGQRLDLWLHLSLSYALEKYNNTKSQEDLDETVIAARDARVVFSIDDSDSSLQVGIPVKEWVHQRSSENATWVRVAWRLWRKGL